MAAEIIDERQDTDENEESQFSEVEEAQQYVEEPSQQQEAVDEVPDKYRGKSAKELVQMHQEAEKLLGRQSTEVGDLRKVVDTYIQTQLSTTNKQQQEEPEDEIDYFSDPEAAVKRAIDNHPKIKEAAQYSDQIRRTSAVTNLQGKHPDMKQILSDPAFGAWIQGSKIRTQLFVQADKQYDHEAADELFSLWKDRREVVANTANAEKQNRQQAVKTASTGGASGSAEQSRKLYRRADIIKLMKDDPDRYHALSDEIMKAYSEGRVKN